MNICISREFGSGGHDIGEQIAMQTGYRFFDRKLVEEAAERSGIAVEHLEKEDEKKANPWLHNVWYESKDENLREQIHSRMCRKGQQCFCGKMCGLCSEKGGDPSCQHLHYGAL